MRELTHLEVSDISGGFTCIDPAMVLRIRDDAMNDASFLSMVVSPLIGLTGFAAASVFAPIVASAAVGVAAGAIGYITVERWAFKNSSVWNQFQIEVK